MTDKNPNKLKSVQSHNPRQSAIQTMGYKKTKIGWLPEDWEVKSISEIGRIYSGGTPDTNNPKFWHGDIYWCIPTDITALNGRRYLAKTKSKITEEGLRNSSAFLLPANSVIVCTRATIGEAAINSIPMATNQGFKSIVLSRLSCKWNNQVLD